MLGNISYDDIYNAEQKRRYMSSESMFKIKVEYTFKTFVKCKYYEEEFGKDICNFSKKEIEEMYKRWNIASFYSITSTNYYLSWYTRWCINQGLVDDSQNHFLEFDSKRLNELLNKVVLDMMIMSREDVEQCAASFENPRDGFIILAIFEFGKKNYYEDVVYACMKDIDFNNKTMKLKSGRIVSISDKLIEYAEDANAAQFYYVRCSNGAEKAYALFDDGTIIKNTSQAKNDTDELKGRRIYTTLSKMLKRTNYDYVTAHTIVNSGKIDMVKRRSSIIGISTKEYVSKHMNEIENQYGENRIVKKTFWEKFGGYL